MSVLQNVHGNGMKSGFLQNDLKSMYTKQSSEMFMENAYVKEVCVDFRLFCMRVIF